GVVAARRDLRGQRADEEPKEDQGADPIAEVQRHRQGIAARLPQRCRKNLDYPERQGYLGDLTEGLGGLGHIGSPHTKPAGPPVPGKRVRATAEPIRAPANRFTVITRSTNGCVVEYIRVRSSNSRASERACYR